mgnify:CR=1 FL=1
MFCKTCLVATALLAPLTMLAASDDPKVATAQAAAAAQTWNIDDTHSMALFRVQHMGAGMFWGRFNDVSGTISTSGAGPDSIAFDISIDVASVSSGNDKLDGHLKSPDFFSVKEFPKMTFKSTKATRGSDGMWDVTGDLTMHGVTKPVTAKVEMIGRSSMGAERVGFEASFSINRSEFGMSYGVEKGAIGNSVRVVVGLEAMPPSKK